MKTACNQNEIIVKQRTLNAFTYVIIKAAFLKNKLKCIWTGVECNYFKMIKPHLKLLEFL